MKPDPACNTSDQFPQYQPVYSVTEDDGKNYAILETWNYISLNRCDGVACSDDWQCLSTYCNTTGQKCEAQYCNRTQVWCDTQGENCIESGRRCPGVTCYKSS